MSRLEHLNITVADPGATAAMLGRLFGWQVRWQGPSIHGGTSVHVGGADSYLALYSGRPGVTQAAPGDSYAARGGLNHLGVVVDDIDTVEVRVKAAGYTPGNHADYDPGQRFYFTEENGIEIEVVQYD
jgi:catechol 2,3-dioxygenase-like lactoylglutathione lyase family enzyme